MIGHFVMLTATISKKANIHSSRPLLWCYVRIRCKQISTSFSFSTIFLVRSAILTIPSNLEPSKHVLLSVTCAFRFHWDEVAGCAMLIGFLSIGSSHDNIASFCEYFLQIFGDLRAVILPVRSIKAECIWDRPVCQFLRDQLICWPFRWWQERS